MVQVTHAIALEAPDKVLSERMSGRWVHPRSGRAYHDVACPPKSLINSFDANRDLVREQHSFFLAVGDDGVGYYRHEQLRISLCSC